MKSSAAHVATINDRDHYHQVFKDIHAPLFLETEIVTLAYRSFWDTVLRSKLMS